MHGFLYCLWFSELIESLKNTGKVITLSRVETEKLLKQSLVCFKCGEEMANMPKLKKHLGLHATATGT